MNDWWPQEKGRYRWWVNGESVPNRYGQPRKDDSWSVKLPVCKPCNGLLNQKFEQPGKEHIRKLMTQDGSVVFDGAVAMKVARWFLKTWLIWAHPATRESVPGIAPSRWEGVADDLYTWMVTEQLPPAGLSMWVTKRGEDEPGDSPTRHIPLPTVVADGRRIEFRVKRAGLRSLDVSLVYHPDWEIAYPLEADGRALRLWPRELDSGADFVSLQPVHPRDTVWLEGPTIHFVSGAFGRGDLPPLSPSFNPMDLGPKFISKIGW